jgi:hypothetical protein
MSSRPRESVQETPMERLESRRIRIRYTLLTAGLFLPLLSAFILTKNFYPVASWTVMTGGGELGREVTYFILRGETQAGETINIPAVELTDALYARNWSMAYYAANNQSFRVRSPHPDNVRMLALAGSVENLPRAARMPELLRAWGIIYNARQPVGSARRLKVIWLDVYMWDGQQYGNYDRYIESWRVEL